MFEVNLPKEQLGNLQPMLRDLQSYKEEAIQNVAKTWYDFLQAFEGPNFFFWI